MATRIAIVLALVVVSGCLGPDERKPHTLHVESYEQGAISGMVTIHQGAAPVLQRRYALAPGAAEEVAFGPASSGAWTILVDPDAGVPLMETKQMGRGGWYLYVNFQNGSISTSTLHGD